MSIWRLAYSALVLAASALARAFAAARLVDDRRDDAELHFDLTSSCERGGVSLRFDMSAFTGVVHLRTPMMHLMCIYSFSNDL